MAPDEKLTCSELKKLQLKRRRTKVSTNVQKENCLQLNIGSLTSKRNDIELENSGIQNPFAKKETQIFDANIEIKMNNSKEAELNFVYNESEYLRIAKNFDSMEKHVIEDTPRKANLKVEKSLKTSVIIETDKSLNCWQAKFSDPLYNLQCMNNPRKDNIMFYYRYPDVSLPQNQKKNIHKSLSNKNQKSNHTDENLIWYRMFSEKWRKSLISAFETLKHGYVNCFYFIQENLTVLFERDSIDYNLKAYLQLTSFAMADDLKNNGIEYKYLSEKRTEIVQEAKDIVKEEEDNKSESDEELDHEIVEIQVKRNKKFFTKEDIVIEGNLSLAELIDFLINQKDRNSYAILPEIYSPGPFVFGTLRSNNISVSGPCKGPGGESLYHLKITGVSFPDSIDSLLQDLNVSGHEIFLTVEREPNTDFLSAYPHTSNMK